MMQASHPRPSALAPALALTAALAAVLLALVSVFGAAQWFTDPERLLPFVAHAYVGGARVTLSQAAWLLLPVIFAALSAPLLVALLSLSRMFRYFGADEPLAGETADAMRRAGLAFLVFTLLVCLSQPAISWLLTQDNPPGERLVVLSFGIRDLLGLVLAGVLVATGHLMVLAADLRADHRQIV